MLCWRKWVIGVMIAPLASMMLGCGGGGGAGSSSYSGAPGNVQIFATDDLSTTYAHAWVTVLGITLTGPSGSVTAYSNPNGQVVDVAALHGSGMSGLYSFLASTSVPTGNYTSATVTMAGSVNLVPTGSNSSTAKSFAGLDSAGNKEVSVPLGTNNALGPGSSLVFDFKLSQWTDTSSGIDCVIQPGAASALTTGASQILTRHYGSVNQLSGSLPNESFVMTTEDNYAVTVQTNSSTVFTNSDGSWDPFLASGQIVVVHGTFSVAQNAFVAQSVELLTGQNANEEAMLGGTLASGGSSASSFSVAMSQAYGFVPTVANATVTTGSSTKFFGFHGESLSATAAATLLPTASYVIAEGSYDSGSGVLSATGIHLLGTSTSDSFGVALRGNLQSGGSATSMTISVTDEKGLSLPIGANVTVVPAATVVYEDSTKTKVTAATFTSDLSSANMITAVGSYTAGTSTLTATFIRITPQPSGNSGGGGSSDDDSFYDGIGVVIDLGGGCAGSGSCSSGGDSASSGDGSDGSGYSSGDGSGDGSDSGGSDGTTDGSGDSSSGDGSSGDGSSGDGSDDGNNNGNNVVHHVVPKKPPVKH